MIILAAEKDLAKNIPKCFNKCCVQLRPKEAKAHGWKKRSIKGYKVWLCGDCSLAYDRKQYCEFCSQVYLENALTLDGKVWAQCEEKECGRWGHVDCLEIKYGKSREEVMADSFKYACGACKSKNKKRTKSMKRRLDGNIKNLRQSKRKCTEDSAL